MNFRTLTLALTIAFPGHAALATNIDDVRVLLLNGDTDRLEATISELAKVKDAESIDAYRNITDRLFRTSHPVYLETLAKWLDSKPKSGAALSANAWAALNDISLKSSPYGSEFAEPPLLEFQQRWQQSKSRASELAKDAMRRDRRNVTAMDAWLYTQRFWPDDREIARVASKLMGLAPDRQSVRNIVAARAQRSQRRSEAVIEVCNAYADRVEGYGRTLCLVEAGIEFEVEQDFKKEAERVLATLDDPRLDPLRFEVAIYASGSKTDVSDLIKMHRSSLTRRADVGRFIGFAQRVAAETNTPGYVQTAEDELLARIEDWLKDDPLNPKYQLHKSAILRSRGQIAEAKEAWHLGVVHGWTDLNVWLEGASIAFEDGDLETGARHLENGAATSGMTMGLLVVHQVLDDGIKQSPVSPSGEVQCLRVRVARLSKGLCDMHGAMMGSICEPSRQPYGAILETVGSMSEACPSLSRMPLSDLRFSPLAVEESVHSQIGN